MHLFRVSLNVESACVLQILYHMNQELQNAMLLSLDAKIQNPDVLCHQSSSCNVGLRNHL